MTSESPEEPAPLVVGDLATATDVAIICGDRITGSTQYPAQRLAEVRLPNGRTLAGVYCATAQLPTVLEAWGAGNRRNIVVLAVDDRTADAALAAALRIPWQCAPTFVCGSKAWARRVDGVHSRHLATLGLSGRRPSIEGLQFAIRLGSELHALQLATTATRETLHTLSASDDPGLARIIDELARHLPLDDPTAALPAHLYLQLHNDGIVIVRGVLPRAWLSRTFVLMEATAAGSLSVLEHLTKDPPKRGDAMAMIVRTPDNPDGDARLIASLATMGAPSSHTQVIVDGSDTSLNVGIEAAIKVANDAKRRHRPITVAVAAPNHTDEALERFTTEKVLAELSIGLGVRAPTPPTMAFVVLPDGTDSMRHAAQKAFRHSGMPYLLTTAPIAQVRDVYLHQRAAARADYPGCEFVAFTTSAAHSNVAAALNDLPADDRPVGIFAGRYRDERQRGTKERPAAQLSAATDGTDEFWTENDAVAWGRVGIARHRLKEGLATDQLLNQNSTPSADPVVGPTELVTIDLSNSHAALPTILGEIDLIVDQHIANAVSAPPLHIVFTEQPDGDLAAAYAAYQDVAATLGNGTSPEERKLQVKIRKRRAAQQVTFVALLPSDTTDLNADAARDEIANTAARARVRVEIVRQPTSHLMAAFQTTIKKHRRTDPTHRFVIITPAEAEDSVRRMLADLPTTMELPDALIVAGRQRARDDSAFPAWFRTLGCRRKAGGIWMSATVLAGLVEHSVAARGRRTVIEAASRRLSDAELPPELAAELASFRTTSFRPPGRSRHPVQAPQHEISEWLPLLPAKRGLSVVSGALVDPREVTFRCHDRTLLDAVEAARREPSAEHAADHALLGSFTAKELHAIVGAATKVTFDISLGHPSETALLSFAAKLTARATSDPKLSVHINVRHPLLTSLHAAVVAAQKRGRSVSLTPFTPVPPRPAPPIDPQPVKSSPPNTARKSAAGSCYLLSIVASDADLDDERRRLAAGLGRTRWEVVSAQDTDVPTIITDIGHRVRRHREMAFGLRVADPLFADTWGQLPELPLDVLPDVIFGSAAVTPGPLDGGRQVHPGLPQWMGVAVADVVTPLYLASELTRSFTYRQALRLGHEKLVRDWPADVARLAAAAPLPGSTETLPPGELSPWWGMIYHDHGHFAIGTSPAGTTGLRLRLPKPGTAWADLARHVGTQDVIVLDSRLPQSAVIKLQRWKKAALSFDLDGAHPAIEHMPTIISSTMEQGRATHITAELRGDHPAFDEIERIIADAASNGRNAAVARR